jgi:hypothetical protein
MSNLPTILGVVGVSITVSSYICKELIDSLERTKSGIQNELATNRQTSIQQSTQMQIVSSRQQLEALQRENSPKRRKKAENIDHSGLITRDIANLGHAQSLVRIEVENVSRLLDKLVFGSANFRKKFEQLKAEIDVTAQRTKEVLKPSPKHDWTRAVEIKLAFLSTIVSVLPLTVFADSVITSAKKQVEILERLVSVGRWIVRILFFGGIGLAAYAGYKGIKVSGGSE